MYTKTVQMTGKGQIVVPKGIRDDMGLGKGSKLVMFQKGGSIILKKPESLERFLQDEFGGLRLASEKVLGKVWEDESDIWESYLQD